MVVCSIFEAKARIAGRGKSEVGIRYGRSRRGYRLDWRVERGWGSEMDEGIWKEEKRRREREVEENLVFDWVGDFIE